MEENQLDAFERMITGSSRALTFEDIKAEATRLGIPRYTRNSMEGSPSRAGGWRRIIQKLVETGRIIRSENYKTYKYARSSEILEADIKELSASRRKFYWTPDRIEEIRNTVSRVGSVSRVARDMKIPEERLRKILQTP